MRFGFVDHTTVQGISKQLSCNQACFQGSSLPNQLFPVLLTFILLNSCVIEGFKDLKSFRVTHILFLRHRASPPFLAPIDL